MTTADLMEVGKSADELLKARGPMRHLAPKEVDRILLRMERPEYRIHCKSLIRRGGEKVKEKEVSKMSDKEILRKQLELYAEESFNGMSHYGMEESSMTRDMCEIYKLLNPYLGCPYALRLCVAAYLGVGFLILVKKLFRA